MAGADPVVRRSDHADFQSNAALAVAKRARARPAEVASAMAETLRADAANTIGEGAALVADAAVSVAGVRQPHRRRRDAVAAG